MQGDVFISYSRRDKSFVEQLYQALISNGRTRDEVWVDWEDIPKAANWWQEIESGIESANTFVFIISPDSAISEICNKEIEYARMNNKRIVPVLYRELSQRDKDILHHTINDHNWIFFRDEDDFTTAFAELINTMDTDLGHVRGHTRFLVRAREWEDKKKDDSFLLTEQEIDDGDEWLAQATGKKPEPTALHREYIRASRKRRQDNQRRLVGIASGVALVTIILAIASIFLFFNSQSNLGTAQERGTEAAIQAHDAQNARATAVFEADNAATQESIAEANAIEAANNAQTAIANADLAENNEAEALARSTEVIEQANTSDANALVAQNNQATSEARSTEVIEQANTSDANALVAQNNQATSEARGTEISNQVQVVMDAQQTAIFEADRAATQESIAEANAIEAANNAATSVANEDLAQSNERLAISALATSESSEILARAQAIASSAQQALSIGDTDLALALALESARLNPELIQAQAVLTSVVNISPVRVIPDSDAIVRFSPDGHRFATVNNEEYAVYLWDLETASQLARLQGHIDTINEVEFSSDGRYLVSASSDISLVVWDADPQSATFGQELHRLTGHDTPIMDIAIHPLEPIVVALSPRDYWSYDAENPENQSFLPAMIEWNIETGEELLRFQQTDRLPMIARFSTDGNTLYTWTTALVKRYEPAWTDGYELINGMVTWSTAGGNVLNTFNTPHQTYSDNGFYTWHDGDASWMDVNQGIPVTIHDARNGSPVRQLINGFDWFHDQIDFIDFSPDSRTIIAGVDRYAEDDEGDLYFVEDRLVYFDIASGTALNRYEFNDISRVTSALFLSDNDTVLSTTYDNQLVLWSAESGDIIRVIGVSDQPMLNLGTSSDERYAFTYSADNTMRVWDMEIRDSAELIRLIPDGEQIVNVGLSVNSDRVFAAVDTDILIYDRDNGDLLRQDYTGGPITSVAFSPVSNQALISIPIYSDRDFERVNGQVIQWLLDTGEVLRIYGDETARYCQMSYSGDGQYAMMAGDLWQVSGGRLIENFATSDLKSALESVRVDPNWSRYWECFRRNQFSSHVDYTFHTISSDNQLLATYLDYSLDWDIHTEVSPGTWESIGHDSSRGSGFYLFSIEDGGILRELEGFLGTPTAGMFSPDNQTVLVTVAEPDNALLLFDINTGEILRRFIGHTAAVNDVLFSPDGLTALSASDDNTLILWDVSTGQAIHVYQGHQNGVSDVALNREGSLAVSTDGQEIIVWRIDNLDDLVTWTYENHAVVPLSCAERAQYRVLPLCDEDIVTATPFSTEFASTPFLRAEIIFASANIRTHPELDAPVIQTVTQGQVLEILEIQLSWYRVQLPDGQSGWIDRRLAQRQ